MFVFLLLYSLSSLSSLSYPSSFARLEAFHNETVPVLKFYGKKVVNIHADNELDAITKEVRDAVNSK